MKRVNKSRAVMVAAVAMAAVAASGMTASAGTIYWDGSGTGWNTVGSWSTDLAGATDPGAIPNINDDVIFGASTVLANQTFQLNANQAAKSLSFTNTTGLTYNIQGGGGGRDLTIGSGGITVAAGSGTVFIGSTTGSLNVFPRIAASQTWTNNSDSLLTVRNSMSAANGVGAVTFTINCAGAGGIADSGTLNDGTSSPLTLVVASTGTGSASIGGGNYSGGTQIKSGQLNAGGLGTGAVLLGDTAGIANATLSITGSPTISNAITVQAGGTTTTITTGSTPVIDGTIVLNHDLTTFTTAASGTMTFSNVVSGGSGIIKAGVSATLVLSGPNTYTGATTIAAGTVSVSSINSVSGGSALLASSSLGAPTSAATATINIGSAALGGTLVYTGAGETTNRIVSLAGVTGGATLTQSGTGLLKFTSNITAPGSVGVSNAKTLTLSGSTAGTGEISGSIVNSTLGTTLTTNVAKSGTGTWTLSGANSYSGVTNIGGGKLLVTGTHTGAGNYNVNNTGTLGGTGTITGATNSAVTVASGGKLAPGGESAPGTLNLGLSGTGRLVLTAAVVNNAGQFAFRLGTVSDKIVLATGLTIGAATADASSLDWSDFTFTPGAGFTNGVYTLVDASINVSGGLSTGGGLLTGSIGGGTGTLSISGSQDLILTVSGIVSTANLTIFPASGNRTSGQSIAITNNNGGTYDITGSSASGYGWSQSGISNGTGLTSSPTGTLTHSAVNAINGSNQGRYTFTVANSSNADGVHAYTLSQAVSGNTASYNVAQSATILSGNTLTGYNVDAARDAGLNQLGTSFTIQDSLALAGDTTLTMTIRERVSGGANDETTANDANFARFDTAGGKLFSDVVSISGINSGTVYVLTVSYDPADLGSVSEGALLLGWLNGSNKWVNAVSGNTSGAAFDAGDISWLTGIGGSLDAGDLGYYGVDTSNNYVWAVLNHNSEFAVIPEPASLGLLALGGLAMLGRRRRDR